MPSSYICPHCGTKTVFVVCPVVEGTNAKVCNEPSFDTVTGKSFDNFRISGNVFNRSGGSDIHYHPDRFVTCCLSCEKFSYWENGRLAFPLRSGILPAPDMPEDAKEVFNEAQAIIGLSPRAACALLRVSLERIVDWYGENENVKGFKKSDKLYKKIETIGISQAFQRICNACRLAGNEHAHSGEIDLSGEDSFEIADAMSRMINSMVNTWITPIRESEEVLRKLGKE